MRKNKFLLPLIGAFLVSISGCDGKNVTVRIKCDHVYKYEQVNSQYHQEVCEKCGETKPNSKDSHSFDPTTNLCRYCSYDKNDEGTICDIHGHIWGDKEIVKKATCTETGLSQRSCTVCGDKEEPKRIKALGHDWVDDVDGYVLPTCTEDGSKKQTCSRCGDKRDVMVAALGHDYGDWTTVEGKAPTCEEKGEEKRVCSRCNKEEKREVATLAHKFVVVCDSVAVPELTKVYRCEYGCGKIMFGFKANEVSEESKTHLNFTEPNEKGEIGASFWGRPIGNSLALHDGYSVYQTSNECVYCSTETGDYFEYIFDLTEAQAAEFSTCRCYCDAKPADYLSGDFWAYNSNSTDWTPGYYIDGSDEHVEKNEDGTYVMVEDHARCVKGSACAGEPLGEDHMVKMGKRVTDYRYVLYVNDEIQEFDPSIKAPVEGSGTNMVRKEYEMPFTFHFKEGKNKVSLHMAGGYISTFYNFTFRPC